jgi:uncharacterized protein (TIGR03382 family)
VEVLVKRAVTVLIVAVTIAGCAREVPVAETAALRTLADRPRGMTIAMSPDQLEESGAVPTVRELNRVSTFAGPGEPPLPIFLNRFGGDYSPGPDNSRNNTSIVPDGPSHINPYPYGDASWQQMVECLTTMFAPYNVVMVEDEPAAGEYVEAVIGGSPEDVGLPDGVGGVAPIDSFQCNIIPRAIVYAFAAVYGNNPQAICETAAQEIAHAFSLDHEFHCPDPMTYLGGCGDKTFRDVDAQCGEFQPRQCNCNRPSQNSVATLIDKLGAAGDIEPVDDPIPPTAQINAPADGATLPQDSVITVQATGTDDVGINAIELVWDFTGDVFPCPFSGNGGSVTCARSGANNGTATWSLRVGQGDRTFSVRVRDPGGNAVTTPERTIHLGAGADTGDTTPPSVTVFNPADGAVLPANTPLTITAQANDETGLASVDLLWTFTGDTFTCPLSEQNISCEQNGSTYTWVLNVGVGTRAFQVRAIDVGNNQVTSVERTITLSADAPPPDDDPPVGGDPAEPNDDADSAFFTRCGSAIDLSSEPGDDDWFAIEAPDGTAVSIDVDASESLGLTAFAADGTTQLGHTDDVVADGPIAVTSTGPALLARVEPGAVAVGYRLTVTCSDGSAPLPPGTDDAFEDNDVIDDATLSFCGQERTNLAALDDDVFKVVVREGDTLSVAVDGAGVAAEIVDENGETIAASKANPEAAGLTAGAYYVRVRGPAEGAGYSVGFECAATPAANTPVIAANSGGCGCDASSPTGATAVFAALGALALRRRVRTKR